LNTPSELEELEEAAEVLELL